MCGIAAIVSSQTEIPNGAIEAMTHCLAYRGPDGHGDVTFPQCHLGHRRLSIIDLATGAQPMTDDAERYWITYNGEIYNYRELRIELQQRGWAFHTQSDTEVIIRAYQEYGESAPQHLNGQFAFVIWDNVERRLFAARDRMGEKPLYWARSAQGHWVFASEIKGLLASGLIEPQLDLSAVDAYLALLYVPPNQSIYSNVHTLPPGHTLTWQAGQLCTTRYWQPAYSQTRHVHLPEVIEHLRVLIAQAVRRQMVADVPVGAFLSGGLDSSTIVALMTQHTSRPVMTFAVGFGNLINELPYARAVAETYQTAHHEIQMDIPVGALLDRMADIYDEPFADSSNIPTYLVAEFARRYVKVALSGDGGDELFGGYDWYRPLLVKPLTNPLTWHYRQGRAALWHALNQIGLPVHAQREAAVYDYAVARNQRRYTDVWDQHLAFASDLKRDRRAWWQADRSSTTEALVRHTYYPDSRLHGLDRATDFDVRCYLPGDILVKVDRAALAHGLESRAPFLDVDLVEFVLNLPAPVRFHGGQLKYLLHAACGDLWPPPVRQRPKQGFGAPVERWVQLMDVQQHWQRVCAANSPLVHLLPGLPVIQTTLKPQQVWTLLCLGLWLEKRPECLRHT